MMMCVCLVAKAQSEKFDGYVGVRVGGDRSENILVSLPKLEGFKNVGLALGKDQEPLTIENYADIFTFMGEKHWTFVTKTEEKLYSQIYTWLIFKKDVNNIKEIYEEFPIHTNKESATQ